MKKIILVLLTGMMALALTACGEKVQEVAEPEDNEMAEVEEQKEKTEEDEEPVEEVVLDVENEEYLYLRQIDKDAKLLTANGEEITIEGDIDWSKMGEYPVVFKYKNSKGEIVEEQKIIFVGSSTAIKEQKTNREMIAKNEATKESRENNSSTVSSGNSNTQDGKVTYSATSGYSGPFPDAEAFAANVNARGQMTGCEGVAYEFIGMANPTGEIVSTPQYGDLISYYDANGNYVHTAVYLGNGLALHGGWGSNRIVTVASENLYASKKYFRPSTNGNYMHGGEIISVKEYEKTNGGTVHLAGSDTSSNKKTEAQKKKEEEAAEQAAFEAEQQAKAEEAAKANQYNPEACRFTVHKDFTSTPDIQDINLINWCYANYPSYITSELDW